MPENEDPTAPVPNDNPGTLGDSHTPIIITDGSASLEFTESFYTKDPETNVNTADDGLHLVNMISSTPHTPGGTDFECIAFQPGVIYEIEAKCKGGGGFNDFKVRGTVDAAPLPEVEFDRGEYKEDPLFPPTHPSTGHRFITQNRQITKVRVFELVSGQRQQPPLHDCSQAGTANNFWTVDDAHLAHDEEHSEEHEHEDAQPQPV
jgi:hypothetical protein